MIEVTQQINAVRRKVAARELAAGDGRVVSISQVYDTDVDDLWNACTSPERLARWFAPVSGELRVGGRYQLGGAAGDTSGQIERCDPPKSFTVTWEYDGSVSWIEIRVTAISQGGARFELEHTMLADDHWVKFGPGATGVGWDITLLNLATYLARQAVQPEEEWAATEHGVHFMTQSSQQWAEASIAAGTNPAEARTQADLTTAFYLAN